MPSCPGSGRRRRSRACGSCSGLLRLGGRDAARPESCSTSSSSALWSSPPWPWARSAPTSWATCAPSGTATPASRAAEVTMPRSLWCRSIRKPGANSRAEHPGGLAVQDRAAGEAAGEHLDRGVGVHAVGLEEDDRLGDQLDGAGHDELVGGLDRLAGAGRADVHDGPADDVQQRPGPLDVGRGTADHDRQRGLDRAGLAAADRCVDDPDAVLVARRGQLAPRRRAGSRSSRRAGCRAWRCA